MSQQFIVPTIFNAFLGIWYYVLMAELDGLQSVPLHMFCILARVFYGICVSFPFDAVIQTALSRLILWVSLFVLLLDTFQVVSIIQQFNSYTLTDFLGVLFSAVFLLCDLLFVLQLYRHATEKKLKLAKQTVEKRENNATAIKSEGPELIISETYDENFRLRRKLKF